MNVWNELQDREKAQTEAIRAVLGDRIDQVVAARDFGAPSAAKRGRNPKYPYVPIIKLRLDGGQLGGYRPNARALREHYGLPRDPLAAA